MATVTKIDWEIFKEWLLREYMPVTAMDRLRYAKKYSQCLLTGNLSSLMLLTESCRVHALKGLATLSKFLGVHESFRQAVKNYGLKWGNKNGDDLILRRLTGTLNPNEIFDWIVKVKKVAPELSNFMDLMATSGVRYNEAIESYNLIINRAKEYYNYEGQVLEHFRFKNTFIRNGKHLFISFVPEQLIQDITRRGEPLEWAHVKKVTAWRVKRLRFADIREFWASYMTRHLKQPEIDFLQGRVSTSVFMRNYFNPIWISDLKDRTLRGVEEILVKVTNHE